MAVIEATDLRRTYRTTTGTFRRRSLDVEAVRGVSFEVGEGEPARSTSTSSRCRRPRSQVRGRSKCGPMSKAPRACSSSRCRGTVVDRDWLTKLMARVRNGFERDEIPSTHRVTVGEDEPFDAFDDEGRRLLHLPAHLTIEPR